MRNKIQTSRLTLCLSAPIKRGHNCLSCGAKHVVSATVSVPHTLTFIAKVLDPVTRNSHFLCIVTVTHLWTYKTVNDYSVYATHACAKLKSQPCVLHLSVPWEVRERTFQNSQKAVQVAYYKVRWVHRGIPQNPGNYIICRAHAQLFLRTLKEKRKTNKIF